MGDLSSVWQETESLVEEMKINIQLVMRPCAAPCASCTALLLADDALRRCHRFLCACPLQALLASNPQTETNITADMRKLLTQIQRNCARARQLSDQQERTYSQYTASTAAAAAAQRAQPPQAAQMQLQVQQQSRSMQPVLRQQRASMQQPAPVQVMGVQQRPQQQQQATVRPMAAPMMASPHAYFPQVGAKSSQNIL